MPRFLFKPSPVESLKQRAYRPFRTDLTRTTQVGAASAAPLPVIWQSPALDTKGYFLINGFVEITILSDTRPANETLELVGVLALDNGGGFQEAATSQINNNQGGGYTGPGSYTFPALASFTGIGRQARFVLHAAHFQGFPARTLEMRLDGVLVGGYGG